MLSDAAQLPNMPLAAAPSYLLLPELAEVAGLMQPAVPAAEYEFALEAKFAMTEAFMMIMACAGHLMSVDCLYNIGWRAGASSCETWHCQLELIIMVPVCPGLKAFRHGCFYPASKPRLHAC